MNNIVPQKDMTFLIQQPKSNLNMIIAGMTNLLDDSEDKIQYIENQNWFQRMCRTVSGKNTMTYKEIQKNYDKISAYVTQALTELYDQQCMDREIVMILGNQLNEMYSEHLQLKQMLGSLKQMLGAFVSKLNEKIESVDNFHMLNAEIMQGLYSDTPNFVSICRILTQMDRRCIQEPRKIDILVRSMENQNILNDIQVTLFDYLKEMTAIPIEDAGRIYLDMKTLEGNYMADIIIELMDRYYFLPEYELLHTDPIQLINSIISEEDFNPSDSMSTNEIFSDLIEAKIDLINGLLPISFIQTDMKLSEAKDLCDNEQYVEAFDIFTTLAKKGCAEAITYIGLFYQYPNDYGNIVNEDEHEAFELFKCAADNGDSDAMYKLGEIYKDGYGVDENMEVAVNWYKQAAKNGNSDAMCYVAYFYRNGIAVQKNPQSAMRWYRRAADLGDSDAMYCIGNMYSNGEGTKQDFKKAAEWYKKADDLKNSNAMHYNDVGSKQDLKEATEWYKKFTMYCIGNIYRNDERTKQYFKKSRRSRF